MARADTGSPGTLYHSEVVPLISCVLTEHVTIQGPFFLPKLSPPWAVDATDDFEFDAGSSEVVYLNPDSSFTRSINNDINFIAEWVFYYCKCVFHKISTEAKPRGLQIVIRAKQKVLVILP